MSDDIEFLQRVKAAEEKANILAAPSTTAVAVAKAEENLRALAQSLAGTKEGTEQHRSLAASLAMAKGNLQTASEEHTAALKALSIFCATGLPPSDPSEQGGANDQAREPAPKRQPSSAGDMW